MSGSSQCPENLVALARDGSPGPRSDVELSHHLRQCLSCRREWAMSKAFQLELAEHTAPGGLAARVAEGVVSQLARGAVGAPPSRDGLHRPAVGTVPEALVRRTRHGNSPLVYLLAAALVLASLTAFATMHPVARSLWSSLRAAREPAPMDSRAAIGSQPIAAPAGGGLAPADPAASSALIAAEAPAEVASEPAAEPSLAPPLLAHKNADPTPTAHELFGSANRARHDDDAARASGLYRELQRRYPASAEAVVSRVSLGRLLLDRLHDPAGALAQFDRYLAESAQDSLAEEALFGRASALLALGRPDAERETWRTLLTRYPNSVYADRARARLEGGQ
jgi:TolA-binding protein